MPKRNFGLDILTVGHVYELRGDYREAGRIVHDECIIRDVRVEPDGTILIGVAFRPVRGTTEDAIAPDGWEKKPGAHCHPRDLRLK